MIIFDANALPYLSVNELREKLEPFEMSSPGICIGTPKDPVKMKALEDMAVQILPSANAIDALKIAKSFMAEGGSNLSVVSADMIYYQILSFGPGVYLDNPQEMTTFTPDDFESSMGIKAEQIVDMLFVIGHPDHGIPQWAPVSPSYAKSWVQNFGNFIELVRSDDSPASNHPMKMIIQSRSKSSLDSYKKFKSELDRPCTFEIAKNKLISMPNIENGKPDKFDGALKSLGEIAKFLRKAPGKPIAIALEGPKSYTSYQLSQNVQRIELHIEGGDTAFIDLADFNKSDERLKTVLLNGLKERKGPKCTDEAKAFYSFLGEKAFQEKNFYLNDICLIAYGLDNRNSEPSLESLMIGYKETLSAQRSEDIMKCYSILRSEVMKPDNSRFKDHILEVEIPLNKILASMEYFGINVDITLLQKNERELRNKAAQVKRTIDKMAGRTMSMGNDEVKRLVFNELKLAPKVLTPKREPSVSDEALEVISDQHPIIPKILEYKRINALITSGIEPIKKHVDRKTRKVHASYNQDLTNTGRLSCSQPNLQAIPSTSSDARYIREAVGVESGKILIKADYSQAEIFVLAGLSGCSRLQNTLMSGSDIHRATAAEVFGKNIKDVTDAERRAAKAINFGVIYGITEYGLAKKIGSTPKEAKVYIDKYFEKYPVIEGYVEALQEHAIKDNWVFTGTGRKIFLKKDGENIGDKELMRRAVNAPMQGTVADIVKKAMVKAHKRLQEEELGAKIIMQVHDEIIFSCDIDKKDRVREIVEEVMSESIIKFMPKVDITVNYTLEKNDITEDLSYEKNIK